jgi:hypothetical protein
MRKIHVLLLMGVEAILLCAGVAVASRNSSGTMSAISGPYVAGTVISAATINARFADIESEITDSLDRSGKGPMLAPMRLTNGTVALPSLTFDSDTDTGIYRVGADNPAVTVGGTKVQEWTSNGLRAANGAVATPSLSFINDTGSGLYRIGSTDIGFAINGVKVQEWNADTTTTKVGDKLSLWGSTPTIGFNLYNNGSNRYMTTNLAGALTLDTTNGFIFYSAPSGTADAVATLTERLRVNASGATFSTGIGADGSGFKHQSVAGCATGAAAGATCTSVLTWTSTFADTSYQAQCTCNATTSGHPVIESYTIAAGSITITTTALTAAAAQCAVITCVAEHN